MKIHPAIVKKNAVFATSVASLCITADKTWIENGASSKLIDNNNKK